MWGITLAAFVVSVVSVLIALGSVWYARQSAKAATKSADLAEVVEAGRHYGWRLEARTNEAIRGFTLRNVGTVNALDVKLSGDYLMLEFHGVQDKAAPVAIAAGQARLFSVAQASGNKGGDIAITWTPDLPDAEPLTWTETPPMAPFYPPLSDMDWRNLVRAVQHLADRH